IDPDPDHRAILERVYQTGEPFFAHEMPSSVRLPNGTLVEGWYDAAIVATKDIAGKIDGVSYYATDVTDLVRGRKRLEELAVATRRRDRRGGLGLPGHHPAARVRTTAQRVLQHGEPRDPDTGHRDPAAARPHPATALKRRRDAGPGARRQGEAPHEGAHRPHQRPPGHDAHRRRPIRARDAGPRPRRAREARRERLPHRPRASDPRRRLDRRVTGPRG